MPSSTTNLTLLGDRHQGLHPHVLNEMVLILAEVIRIEYENE